MFNRNCILTSEQGCVVDIKHLCSDLLFIFTSAILSALIEFLLCLSSEDTTDLVFEEFKRSYLKGIIGDDDESPAEP